MGATKKPPDIIINYVRNVNDDTIGISSTIAKDITRYIGTCKAIRISNLFPPSRGGNSERSIRRSVAPPSWSIAAPARLGGQMAQCCFEICFGGSGQRINTKNVASQVIFELELSTVQRTFLNSHDETERNNLG